MRPFKISGIVLAVVALLLSAAWVLPDTSGHESVTPQAEEVAATQPTTDETQGEEPADHGTQVEEPADHGAAESGDADHAESEEDHDEGFWFGESADPAEADRVIEITAGEFFFSPDPIEVRVGEVVTFRVTNVGKVPHDFTIGDKKIQLKHEEEMAEMLAAGKMGEEEVGEEHGDPNTGAMDPGETVEVTWRFTAPGLLEIGCHVPGHYAAGMLVPLEVRA